MPGNRNRNQMPRNGMRKQRRRRPRRSNDVRQKIQGSSVASTFGSMDRAEQGISNSFVPALSTPKFRGRLRYGAAALNFTGSTALVASYVFSANGLFDPNITGGSLSPAGFAQLIASYNHYIVSYARISVIFTNNATTPSIVGITVNDDPTVSTDPSNMLELPYSQFVQLEGAPAYGSSKTINMSLNLSKYFGENVLRTTGIYRGDAVSNPMEQCYFILLAAAVKGGTTDTFFNIKIDYYATFTEPRDLSPSLSRAMYDLVVRDERERKKSEEEKKGTWLGDDDPPELIRSMRESFGALEVNNAECFHSTCGCVCAHNSALKAFSGAPKA